MTELSPQYNAKEVEDKIYRLWEKSGFSNPSANRYHQIFEYMFVLSKGKPKSFNSIKDRKNKHFGVVNHGTKSQKECK